MFPNVHTKLLSVKNSQIVWPHTNKGMTIPYICTSSCTLLEMPKAVDGGRSLLCCGLGNNWAQDRCPLGIGELPLAAVA